MALVWSEQGGWSQEEEELLFARYGDDTTLDIIERSPVDARVVITWVGWDRRHPEIYVVDFRARTKDGYVIAEPFMTVALAKEGRWAAFFPAAQPTETA